MSELFYWPVRVYYEDTDASGVVYHARYLHWFERARSEWLRSRGRSHQRMADEFGAAFTVASLEVRYLKPARLDESLVVSVAIAQAGHASLVFAQQAVRAGAPETLLSTARVRVACVDGSTFRPRAWPTGWLDP